MKSTKSQKHSKLPRYFFQFKLTQATVSATLPASFKLVLYKGVQKLDQTKEIILCQNYQTDLEQTNIVMNFYTDIEESKRTSQYRVIVENEQQKKMGQAGIDIFPIVDTFLKNGTNQFHKTIKIEDIVAFDILVFLERTKQNLTRSILSCSQTSSNYKFRSEPNKSFTYSINSHFNQTKHKDRSGNIKQQSKQVITADLSKTSGFKQQSQSKDYLSKPAIQHILKTNQQTQQQNFIQPQKQLPKFDDDFDSISMIQSQSCTKQGSLSTKFILICSIIFLALLCYFIITLQDQKLQLSLLSRKLITTLKQKLQNDPL